MSTRLLTGGSNFFNVHDGVDILDEVGTELADMEAVRHTAILAAGEAIRELGSKFWDSKDWQLEVTDESGKRVLTMNFSGNDQPE